MCVKKSEDTDLKSGYFRLFQGIKGQIYRQLYYSVIQIGHKKVHNSTNLEGKNYTFTANQNLSACGIPFALLDISCNL